MIVKPEQMDFSNKNIVMIISGMPGVGKTTLALSAPDVILIDADEGMCRVNAAHRKDSSVCKSYKEILEDTKAMVGQYKTVVIDTAGALIEMMKEWAMENDPKASKTNGGFSLQGYGIIKSEFLRFTAELRRHFNVIYLFHETMSKVDEDVFYELVCEGAAKTLVWQPADLGAHMFIQDGQRMLGFSPTAKYSAKSAYGIKGIVKVPELNEGEPNTFLTTLFETIRERLTEENKGATEAKEQYDRVMSGGLMIIDAVKEPEHVTEVLATIDEMKHALTSEKELKAALKKKLKELNIVYNKETKAYEFGQ
jgi:hypothetical protein